MIPTHEKVRRMLGLYSGAGKQGSSQVARMLQLGSKITGQSLESLWTYYFLLEGEASTTSEYRKIGKSTLAAMAISIADDERTEEIAHYFHTYGTFPKDGDLPDS
jgi:hypothetical protein